VTSRTAAWQLTSPDGKTALNWTSAAITTQGTASFEGRANVPFIDVAFVSTEGDMHWVIFTGQRGAYQYFVNRALPVLGEFRSLWRLDNTTFTRGRTASRDSTLPPLADFVEANRVQDETWRRPVGDGYITKYDLADWLRGQKAWGVYGPTVGSWYIHAGQEYLNGNQLKQELMVHRESRTGDTVQLNMIHGGHFQAVCNDRFAVGRMWGPWLWYLVSLMVAMTTRCTRINAC
jgi:rhamnogalacturonan endolyase